MIRILPLGEVNREYLEFLKVKLRPKFGEEVGILKGIELPPYCYNPFRKQYNSTCILRRLEPVWLTLAVTEVDLYADNLNFVFGEAELGGSRAIVSTYRLKFNADESKVKERLVKEAVHELGHVYGLRHCSNKECVMSFSNSVFDVDFKSEDFCEDCRRRLGL